MPYEITVECTTCGNKVTPGLFGKLEQATEWIEISFPTMRCYEKGDVDFGGRKVCGGGFMFVSIKEVPAEVPQSEVFPLHTGNETI